MSAHRGSVQQAIKEAWRDIHRMESWGSLYEPDVPDVIAHNAITWAKVSHPKVSDRLRAMNATSALLAARVAAQSWLDDMDSKHEAFSEVSSFISDLDYLIGELRPMTVK
jgi:hypothetical protein